MFILSSDWSTGRDSSMHCQLLTRMVNPAKLFFITMLLALLLYPSKFVCNQVDLIILRDTYTTSDPK
jgi:hypothetical protein